jgi:hypothetical protein
VGEVFFLHPTEQKSKTPQKMYIPDIRFFVFVHMQPGFSLFSNKGIKVIKFRKNSFRLQGMSIYSQDQTGNAKNYLNNNPSTLSNSPTLQAMRL